jgi:bacteriorhodopsin
MFGRGLQLHALRELSETFRTFVGESVTRRFAKWFITLPRLVRILWLFAAVELITILSRSLGS